MAKNTKIEWTAAERKDGTLAPGHTANLWWGCSKVHDGCNNCYAETWANIYEPGVLWNEEEPVRKPVKSVWNNLLTFNAHAHAAGEIHNVFVGSMMDIFEKPMPLMGEEWAGKTTGDLRDRFFREFVPMCTNLRFLLLTKRPSNIKKYVPAEWLTNPPENVMYGTSPVNQLTYHTLVRQLLEVPGKRFLSIEPQLGPINLNKEHAHKIAWIIQGGESGGGKRPFDLKWAYSMQEQCRDLSIPYFFKQVDKVIEPPADLVRDRYYLPSERGFWFDNVSPQSNLPHMMERMKWVKENKEECHKNGFTNE